MKLELDISPELEEVLVRDAEQEGITVQDLAMRRLIKASTPRKLAEAVAPYVIPTTSPATRSARDSGTQFSEHLAEKKKQGSL